MKIKHILLALVMFGFASCEFDEQVNPNSPSINSVASNATSTQLNLLVTGFLADMRAGYGEYITGPGSIAREMYRFDADPRNTEDLLGKDGMALDNNTFYLTSPYNTRYRVIKTANILLDALDNTSNVSESEKNGYRGVAKTMQALMYTQVLNFLGSNGIRFDVSDPTNLGPFISESEGWSAILNLYDEALNDLNSAGSLPPLTSGFDGFTTPDAFAELNRALKAQAAARAGNYAEALSSLNGSFFDIAGDFSTGPEMIFSTVGVDRLNPVFRVPGENGNQLVVHNRFIEDATAGDARLSKFAERPNPSTQDGLTGTHETALYASNTSPIDIIRNEELIFIWTEAQINQNNLGDAVNGINVIRNEHGIGDYSGAQTQDALIDEWLYQRGYSFWGEAKLMFDLRKYGKLNTDNLPLDRDGDLIHTQFPIPLAENQ